MNKNILILLLTLPFWFFACNNSTEKTNSEPSNEGKRNVEAREDSIKLAEALSIQAQFENKVFAIVETEPTISQQDQDAADDPAVFISSTDKNKAYLIGTNKKSGLEVYDMTGKRLQHIECGKTNNVDLRNDFQYQGRKGALVGTTNRIKNSISFFFFDNDSSKLSDEIYSIPTTLDEVYGFCMHKDLKTSKFYAVVNGKNGTIEQYEIRQKSGKISHELVNTFKVKSQPEGLVADDETQMLYIGVEEEAIFKASLKPHNDGTLQMLNGSDTTNSKVKHDIEGLALFAYNGKKYLIASSQGNFSYALFKLGNPDQYITNFVIATDSIDGVEETDGLEVSPFTYGGKYPNGIFIVQDGYNFEGDKPASQNFKIVPMDKIVEFTKLNK